MTCAFFCLSLSFLTCVWAMTRTTVQYFLMGPVLCPVFAFTRPLRGVLRHGLLFDLYQFL